MLMLLCIIVCIPILTLGISPHATGSTTEDVPWIVSLQMNTRSKMDFPYCGATLIQSQLFGFENEAKTTECSGWVLTAASCLHGNTSEIIATLRNFDVNNTTDTNKTALEIIPPFVYDSYKAETHENDIALIHVHFKKVNVSDDRENAEKFCNEFPVLQYQHDHKLNETHYPNITATMYGWGLKRENGLLQKKLGSAKISLRSDKNCSGLYQGTRLQGPFETNMKNTICAGGFGEGSGACSYDTGGPLKCDYKYGADESDIQTTTYLCGIASFGSGCDLPAVYTDVAKFKDWIDETIKNPVNPSISD